MRGDVDANGKSTLARRRYPYLPVHITQPRECKKVYLAALSETGVLAVPKLLKLVAVPIFDIYDNASRYGALIASIPHLIARFDLSSL
jgi:cleavage and polyadenylation specificity factor subunit 5